MWISRTGSARYPGFQPLSGDRSSWTTRLPKAMSIDPDGTEEYEMQVFHTPGHSPGSVSLLLPRERALFCGDVIPVEGDLPVYDDALESVRSIRRLRGVRDINVLLSAWDEPREGDLIYQKMDRALAYLQKIHAAVVTGSEDGTSDLMEVTKRVVAALELPPQMVTPLLARTFAANLRIRDRKDLLAEQN